MASLDELMNYSKESEAFFAKYTKTFHSEMSEEKFNKFRLFFLNLITENLTQFFDIPRKVHLITNTIQIALNVWNEIPNMEETKNELFIFFFVASCFIVIKLESPSLLSSFKSWVIDHEINLYYVQYAERWILSKCGWDLYLDTPAQIQLTWNKILSQNESIKDWSKYQEIIETWIQFTINENVLYSRYDLFTITLSSYLIAIQNSDEESSVEVQHHLIDYIKCNSKLISLSKIQECSNAIISCFQSADEDENEENLSESEDWINYLDITKTSGITSLTRSSSVSSLNDIFSQYENKCAELQKTSSMTLSFNIFEDENNSFLNKKRKCEELPHEAVKILDKYVS